MLFHSSVCCIGQTNVVDINCFKIQKCYILQKKQETLQSIIHEIMFSVSFKASFFELISNILMNISDFLNIGTGGRKSQTDGGSDI